MNAAIYVRVSSKDQVEGYSLSAQMETCRQYAKEKGWTVVAEYSDKGESARTTDRPFFQEMLENLDGVQVVLVHKLDRLARSLEDHVAVRAMLTKHGVKLVSVTENLEESASGKLVEGVLAAINEFYSANLAQEVRKGMSQKAREGIWPTKAPIGYRNVRSENGKRRGESVLHLDGEQAPLVHKAFELYAKGEWSIQRLYEEMRKRGMSIGSPSRLNAMLQNPIYLGKVVWKDVEYEGKHEPIVSRELFDQVQAVLRAKNTGDKAWKYDHHLKGILTCICGSRMSYSRFKHGKHGYFFCLRMFKGGACAEPYVPEDVMEREVEELYRDIAIPKALHKEIEFALETEIANQETDGAEQASRLAKRMERLAKERRKLLEAWYAEALPLDLFKQEQLRIDAEISEIEAQIGSQASQVDQAREIIHIALTLVQDPYKAYRKASPGTRRLWNRAFFRGIVVKDKRVAEVSYEEPFATLLGSNNGHLVVPTGFEPVSPP